MTNEDLNQIAGTLITNAIDTGMDRAAQIVADAMKDAAGEDELYQVGMEDAINALVQAGARRPR